ncbi:MAG: cell division protein ZapA [Alphaproteobacteria bacterium]|nr:cell division protein ZapA [Alphaproteobacteria bacterium]
MAQVNVEINGRGYDIACDNGQEEHLERLASFVDKRIGELTASVGQIGDARLLVMVSLLIADELADAYADLAKLKSENDSMDEQAADQIAAKLDTLAARIENIADRLVSA